MIRASDRYQEMRAKQISKLESELEEEVNGLRLTDDALNWMIKDSYPRSINADQRARYRQAMKKEKWNDLKKAWLKLTTDRSRNRSITWLSFLMKKT